MNRLLAILSVLTLGLGSSTSALVVSHPYASALPPASVEIVAESAFSFPVAEDWCRNNTMGNADNDGVDPLGLVPGGGNPVSMGPGTDFYPRGGWSSLQGDFEQRTMSGVEAAAKGIAYSPLVAMRIAALPGELLANQYMANYQYSGSAWGALNMTLNPVYLVVVSEEELRAGMGYNWYNAGQRLTGEQKCESGVNMVLGGVQTVFIAVPLGKVAAGSQLGRTLTLMAEEGGNISYRQASQIAALSRFLETAPLNSVSLGPPLVVAPIFEWGESVTLPQVRRGAIQGGTFERYLGWGLRQVQEDVVSQITLKTPSGWRPRLDFVGAEPGTRIVLLTEGKSSLAAPLTEVQAAAFAEIEVMGAVVVGEGKPPFVGGTVIPPTRVRIIRAPR